MHHKIIGAVTIEFDTDKMTQDEFTELEEHLHDKFFNFPDDEDFYYLDEDFEFESNQDSSDWSLENDHIKKTKENFIETHSEMLEKLKTDFGSYKIDYRIFDIIC